MNYISFIFFSISFLFLSCGKSEKVASSLGDLSGNPCNIKVIVSGKAPIVNLKLFSKAKEKAVTIVREINVLDDVKDEFSFSSYTGGKLSCELKTKDSYGPEVTLVVLVNGKVWQEKTGRYNPKIEGLIPVNIQ
tara:strand:+ start:98 stop:499 length:402 start_codon:yes stop_codon:yes gene_type:complete